MSDKIMKKISEWRVFLQDNCQELLTNSNIIFDSYFAPFKQVIKDNTICSPYDLLDMFKLSLRYKYPVGPEYNKLYIVPFKGKLQPIFSYIAYRERFRKEAGLDVEVFDFTKDELDKLNTSIVPMNYENIAWDILTPESHTKENISVTRVNSYKISDGTLYKTKWYTKPELLKGINTGRGNFWSTWSREMVLKTAAKKFIKEHFISSVNDGSNLSSMINSELEYELDGNYINTKNIRKPIASNLMERFNHVQIGG